MDWLGKHQANILCHEKLLEAKKHRRQVDYVKGDEKRKAMMLVNTINARR